MITRGSGEIDWYSYDLPSKIDDLTDSSYAEFWYGPDRSRIKQYQSSTGVTLRYAGTLFEFEDAATDTYRHYVQAGDLGVAVVERVATTNTRQYLHRDHQGSVVKVTNASGTVDQALAFDAWGLRRNASDWSALGSPFAGSHEIERGYTGHEHLDAVGLIHMNGRVQDPILGRFISADPLIQAPYHTQSHNRYSYVWNNPASMIDPSGFQTLDGDTSGWCQFLGLRCLIPSDGDWDRFQTAVQDLEDWEHDLYGDDLAGPGCCGHGPNGFLTFSGMGTATPESTGDTAALPANPECLLGEGSSCYTALDDLMTPFEVIPFVGQVPRATYSLGRGIARLFGRSATTRVGVWSMQPVVRGVALERAYGGNLPPYFPVIDRFVDGIATSIKSIDLSANSYQSMSALTTTMTRYIDKLSTFAGAARMGARVRGPEITARTLEVIVPAGSATAAQQAVINAAVQYGQTVGVAVKIIEH